MPEVGARAADVNVELESPAYVMENLSILSNMQLNWLCSTRQKLTCHSMTVSGIQYMTPTLAARSTMM